MLFTLVLFCVAVLICCLVACAWLSKVVLSYCIYHDGHNNENVKN